ncbi:CP [Botryosphaeria dothidea victorivirus 2]|uniref:CP n=1 Tax=Botryosphaeria dothidea victorivirus 2 TaxID=2516210 RepID=A0A411EWI0_9VIRU|nr:CP [Botryosphaeria dothidea victorivirus 2]
MEDHALRNAFLASIVSAPKGQLLVPPRTRRGKKGKGRDVDPVDEPAEPPTYRRYRSYLRTDSTIAGLVDSRTATIQYEIGPRFERYVDLFASLPADIPRMDVSYPSATTLAEDFVGLARKHSNFSASFKFSSLAALVERVGKVLAATTVFQRTWNSDDIRGGEPLYISALGTLDGPVNSLAGSVFIPRLVDNVMSPDVFAVLINAAAGEGSRVVTDVLEIDAVTRRPILPVVDAPSLIIPCVEALRILGANMVACDQGPLFALALVRGLNAALSLVGHTDEGAVTRDLLRVSGFDTPFGGIHYGLEPYSGLPALATNSLQDTCAFVDSLLIASAALVAHCDPGTTYAGQWFPTVLQGTGPDVPETRPGTDITGTADMARRNKNLLANAIPRFAEFYGRGLGRLFAADGDTRLVANTLSASSRLLADDCRHLRYPSVSPFFWVEPTGLLPPDFLGSPAEDNSCGSLAFRGSTRTRAAWDDIVRIGEQDTAFTAYAVSMRFARSSWFLSHWLNHPANGLGALQVRQLDPNGVIHPGPCPGLEEVRDRVEAALPLTSYLWTRGQSPLPAPGEFLNLGGTIGLLARHLTLDDDGIPTEEHLPTAREFLDTVVSVTAGRLVGLANGQHNSYDSNARRARTRATRELAAASARARLYGTSSVAELPILTTAPRLRGGVQVGDPQTANPHQAGGVSLGYTRHGGHTRHDDPPLREERGDPAHPVQHNDAVRGPPLPQQGPAHPNGPPDE